MLSHACPSNLSIGRVSLRVDKGGRIVCYRQIVFIMFIIRLSVLFAFFQQIYFCVCVQFRPKGCHESGMSVITEKGHNSTSLAKLIVLRTETPPRKNLESFSENQTSLSLKTKPWRGHNRKTDNQTTREYSFM